MHACERRRVAPRVMLYTFRSKATAELIMLGPHGDKVLALLGREPSPRGIFDVQDLPQLIATLERAVADDTGGPAGDKSDDVDDEKKSLVGLRARVWPLVEMMRRSLAAREPITWGV
jgi:hypothetical protein